MKSFQTMNWFWWYLALVCGFLTVPGLCQADECDNPVDISDEHRSVNYKSDDGHYLCDYGVIQDALWYTFDVHTGGKMPETCPDFYSCGTQAPIWFSGTHPTDSEVHDAKACVKLDGCCDIEYPIQVKKCQDGKYVYNLTEPEACDLAYCAGEGQPCAAGTVWVESENACTGSYPVMSAHPHLSDPKEPDDLYKKTFWFECEIKYDGGDSALFEVRWYFDSVEDPNIPPEITSETSAKLDELKLIGHMGKTVSCSAKSYWPDHSDTPSDTWMSENGYWIGIKKPDIIDISEQEVEVTFYLESTVPITCGCCIDVPNGFKDRCKFQVKINEIPRFGIGSSGCVAIFNPENSVANFTLSPNRESMKHLDVLQILFQKFDYENKETVTSIWKDYTIGPVQVVVRKDKEIGHCISVTDPHIKTFDRMKRGIGYYHLYQPGKFILVKSTSERVFEIHSLLRTCLRNPSVSCNCGVAVREGNMILGVDNCNSTFRTFQNILGEGTLNTATLTTDELGTTFTIVMPSGARIEAKEDKMWHLNVHVFLPSEFKNTTSGLCGSWDGDYENDFKKQFTDETLSSSIDIPKDFTESYRIKKGESFFERLPCDRLLEKQAYHYCKCNRGIVICNKFGRDEVSIEHTNGNNCKNRTRREEDDFKRIFADLSVEEEYIELGELTWPTPSGITKQDATTRCEEVLEESAVYSLCQNVPTVNTEDTKSICVLDVQIADNLTVADSLKNVFENTCQEEARLNTATSNNDTVAEAAKLADAIASQICINQCSGHGTCQNGTCQCDSDYLAADCSINRGKAPVIKEVAFEGICDTYLGTCQGIKLSADVIIAGVVCRFTTVKASDNGMSVSEDTETAFTESAIISNTKVICNLPTIAKKVFTTYHLALSFDGEMYSEETMVSVFDSVCIDCTVDGVCMIKPDSCVIDGECYTGSVCTACEDSIDIGHPKRSSAYKTGDNEDALCDASLIEQGKWYRFGQSAAYKIPNQCVEHGHCGTRNPIWLNGTNPTADTPVIQGLVCANYNSTCCAWSAPVTAKYCTNNDNQPFYAYQLIPPPYCETAYCSGDKIYCEEGEVFDEGTETCADTSEGTVIEIGSDSLQLVTENEDNFKKAIAGSIDNYCSTHTEECCQAMDLEFSQSGSGESLKTFLSVILQIQEDEDTSNIIVIIVVKVKPTGAIQFCGTDQAEESLTLSSDTVANAIIANIDAIESDTGIQINGVGRQTEATDGTSPSDPDVSRGNRTLIIVLSAVGAVVLVAAIIILILACVKSKGNKEKPKRGHSQISVASETTVQGIGNTRASTDQDVLFVDQFQSNSPSMPPQYFNYKEMRPKTGVQRQSVLPPLD